ncbi:MAG TPA: monovalent cation/H+ antiporter complex subunit F [Steroidobacteraceae bacterium]|nr:monovalent cation/H+ antiporter complex subunit F [Steroidobacteraceae bacterium]
MSPWLLAFVLCVPPFALAAYRALSGRSSQRLVATELAAGIGTLMLVLASFAWPHDELLDLALALGLVSVPGTLVFTHFLERWL